MSFLHVVKTYSSRFEAESARSVLQSQGIVSVVEGDDCGGMRPDMAFATGGYDLLVGEPDLSKARDLLDN